MADPVWNTDIYECPTFGTVETSRPSFIDDPSEDGGSRRRARTTRRLSRWSVRSPGLTFDKVELFETFFDVDLALGVKSFLWVRPRPAVSGTVTKLVKIKGQFDVEPLSSGKYRISYELLEV